MQRQAQRPQVVIVGAGFAGLEASKALAKDRRRRDACRRVQSPLLSAAALSGRNRGAVSGRCRVADPRHSARPAECPCDHGARDRDRRASAPCAHDRDRPAVRLSGPRHRIDALLFRPRRLGAVRARAQTYRGCDRNQAAVPARVRACGSGRGRRGAGAAVDLRHHRRRRDRCGNGRRDRGGGAANPAARFPPHRPAQIAHHSDRGRPTLVADISEALIRLCAALTARAWASRSSSIAKSPAATRRA